MALLIRYFPEENKRAIIAQFPGAEPKDWAVMDDSGFVYTYCDTEEEARIELAKLEREESITDAFDAWVTDMAKSTSLDRGEVKQVIKDHLY